MGRWTQSQNMRRQSPRCWTTQHVMVTQLRQCHIEDKDKWGRFYTGEATQKYTVITYNNLFMDDILLTFKSWYNVNKVRCWPCEEPAKWLIITYTIWTEVQVNGHILTPCDFGCYCMKNGTWCVSERFMKYMSQKVTLNLL